MIDLEPVKCGCGGEARIGKIYGDAWTVECTECGIQSGCYDSEAEAIEAWNRAMGGRDINVPTKERTAKVRKIAQREAKILFDGKCECGYDVSVGELYCPNCGAKLDWSEDIPIEYFESGGR